MVRDPSNLKEGKKKNKRRKKSSTIGPNSALLRPQRCLEPLRYSPIGDFDFTNVINLFLFPLKNFVSLSIWGPNNSKSKFYHANCFHHGQKSINQLKWCDKRDCDRTKTLTTHGDANFWSYTQNWHRNWKITRNWISMHLMVFETWKWLFILLLYFSSFLHLVL